MPRILLVSLNRETVPYPVFPLGVWVLHNYLVRQGVEVDVADLFLLSKVGEAEQGEPHLSPTPFARQGEDSPKREEHPQDAPGSAGGPRLPLDRALGALTDQFLARRNYDCVGLSLRNIDNLSWPSPVDYRAEAAACIERARQYVRLEQIVLGGAGYSIFGEQLLEAFGLRNGVSGEGEQALLQRVSQEARVLPPPDYSFAEGVPGAVLQHYYHESGMIGLQTRRGCPFDCSYCTYPQIEGRSMRHRSVSSVLVEIRRLKEQHSVEVFYFVDCNFNYPPAYTRELLEGLAAAQLGIRWYAFVNPAYFDDSLARLMKSAGCGGVEFGSESGDPLVLQSFSKDYGPDRLLAASRACQAARLKFCHYLLLGAPGETLRSVAATLELIKTCRPSTAILTIGLRLYPGTALARSLIQQSRLDPRQSLLEPTFYQPEQITLPEILEYCQAHAPAHWIIPGRGDQQMAERMCRLRRRGARGPLWDYL